MDLGQRLLDIYTLLDAHFGHEPHWWPITTDDPPFEILVGMVLVQQTRWQTVEAAVGRLREAGLLSPGALAAADTTALAALIRPCAFHTQKAPGLQAICRHILARHGGETAAMLRGERAAVRAELLALPRVGPETADTVMLYAGGHAGFIADAYARRLLGRLGVAPRFKFDKASYDAVQALVEGALISVDLPVPAGHMTDYQPPPPPGADQRAAAFYWRFHALIVEACIHHCLPARMRQDRRGERPSFVDPRKCLDHCFACHGCPLREVCATYHAGNAERSTPA